MKLNNHLISLLRNFRNCIFISLLFVGCSTGGAPNQKSKVSGEKKWGELRRSTKGTEDDNTLLILSKTLVIGAIDPDVIRRILRDYIPFFRSCYKKELNKNTGKDIYGATVFQFFIGASGHVAKAGVSGKTSIPGPVKSCVVGLLRGIKFPQPRGGGTVEVKQPFNFFAKKL